MLTSTPVDGFRLAYEQAGAGPPVVLLHGWPGDHTDFEALAPLLTDTAEVVVPDLRGFGRSDKHAQPPAEAYSAAAQARSVRGLIDELGLERPLIAGYDIGSRIAQAIARSAPDAVRALVVSPPLPGAGDRVLTADALREFWYGSERACSGTRHQGSRDAVRTTTSGCRRASSSAMPSRSVRSATAGSTTRGRRTAPPPARLDRRRSARARRRARRRATDRPDGG
jgi:pimeloyl-ACP methyl ester carboxylesterase